MTSAGREKHIEDRGLEYHCMDFGRIQMLFGLPSIGLTLKVDERQS